MFSWQKQLTPEEVKAKIEYEESLSVEERRKRYKCQRYFTLSEVKPWSVDLEDFQKIERDPPIDPLFPANALINQKISHFTGNSKFIEFLLYSLLTTIVCTMEIDAIVNAANESMLGGGGSKILFSFLISFNF